MKISWDAYGFGLDLYYHGMPVQEVVERDDGYIDVSLGPEAYFQEYEEWPPYVKTAFTHARGRVLDIGSGAGRHAVYLQQQGCDVLGIDVSETALKVARARGLRKTRQLSITMISHELGMFDTILMMGNNFGLFGSVKRARWLLKKFYGLTTGDACIIAASLDPHQTDNPFHLAYHRRNVSKGRMPGQIRLRVRYFDRATPWFDYLLVSQDEMKQILDGTGWCPAHVYDAGGPVYVAVIKKIP
jgi:SAM-dependent methyltransferase